MPNLNNYITDSDGNIYAESDLSQLSAVDPNHWLTARQQLQQANNAALASIASNNALIAANILDEQDFFTQFPDKVYEGYSTPIAPTLVDNPINNPITLP